MAEHKGAVTLIIATLLVFAAFVLFGNQMSDIVISIKDYMVNLVNGVDGVTVNTP